MAGPHGRTLVVPLDDVAFPGRGEFADDPGKDGWCSATFGETVEIDRRRPDFWRDYRMKKWYSLGDGQLVCPDLVRYLDR